jgi:pimeloyl-ACP methyl ester carboxylesterase
MKAVREKEMTGNRDLNARITPLARPKWLPESVWPFQSFGLEVDDSVLAVTDVGHGPVLLFVHAGTWSFIWRDLMTRLAADFRCICFDAPGNGRTRDGAAAVSLDKTSHAVTGLIERLGLEEVTLVAHDLGGVAGLAGIARTPERIRGIVAMNAFAWKPSGAAFRTMLAVIGSGFMRELNVLTGFIPRLTSTSFGVGRHLDEPARQAFFAGMGTRGRRAFHNYIRDARQCDNLYDEIARALAGPLSRLPLLTIFGERNDPFGFQQRWKALYPDARQVVVAKGNHFPMCDDPDLAAREIRSWYRECVAPTVQAPSTFRARVREAGLRR